MAAPATTIVESPSSPTDSISATALVNGVQLFYRITGEGPPLLLLHGGYSDHHAFDGVAPILAKSHRVIAVDSRGHGASGDVQGPYTYQLLTQDILALMEYLHLPQADIVGWSDGAVVALQMAIDEPAMVRRAILIGATIQFEGSLDSSSEWMISHKWLFQRYADWRLRGNYLRDNPKPKNWPEFRDKVHDMWRQRCYLAPVIAGDCGTLLKSINTPMLIIVGDDEMIRTAHTRMIHKAIKTSRLLTIPDADHFVVTSKPKIVGKAILDFLKISN